MSDLALALLVSFAGVVFAAVIVLLARRGALSMRYTLGWLFVALCVVLGGPLSWLVDPIAEFVGVSPQSLVSAAVGAALLALTVQLSITVSGLTEIVRSLSEAHALLEEEARRLRQDPDGARGSAVRPDDGEHQR